MIRIVFGVILMLHGLVHLWFVTLAVRWVAFQPDMGWTGRSWFLTPTLGEGPARIVAAVFLSIAAATFVFGGIAVLGQVPWWRPALVLAAILSTVVLLLVWDGGTEMLIQKGLIGVVINVLVLIVVAR